MAFLNLTPFEIEALRLSLKVSLWAVLISLAPGILAAWLLARKKFFGKAFFDSLIHLPLVLPPVVTGYFLLVLLGKKGIVGSFLFKLTGVSFAFNWKGAALASGVMAFPLFVRAVRLSLEAVDSGLEDAARTLGASRLYIFVTITLPLILPGILTGMILAFARSLSEFGATITFVSNIPGETRTLPLALYTMTQVPNGDYGAARLCIISVVTAFFALMAADFLSQRLSKMVRGD
jgi:molybdate transport system permease protein